MRLADNRRRTRSWRYGGQAGVRAATVGTARSAQPAATGMGPTSLSGVVAGVSRPRVNRDNRIPGLYVGRASVGHPYSGWSA
ncbi:hypothetical protein GCM10010300_05690 [Streptomyces olivaceoviridis]|nr:hypothetical protein GCM10010300_05690 [Streptomyces olivaceoviridis]